ncbi:MAG: 4Fe-4S binding protein [Bacteroidales bacterium]|nr:4Fe-4S binding protein [Bacteroidales bacterium]MDD4638529.1 4Fe-4S binding protein [Bacteroidales bacterium]
MKRTVINIDEDLCNGCGNCVTGCHEGALQLINGKAVMISELYCDGLGACIGECPTGAIELIEKEAEPYNETAVMERISTKGEKVIIAHLKHLKNHGADKWFKEGVEWCRENLPGIDLSELTETKDKNCGCNTSPQMPSACPGSKERDLRSSKPLPNENAAGVNYSGLSRLTHWPVQLHLQNPASNIFRDADLLLASDCSAFSSGDFHERFLKNKTLSIACPKLDSNLESYHDKLRLMILNSGINTITVLIMEVPCCSGLLQLALNARKASGVNIPVKVIKLSVEGKVLSQGWV